MVLVLTKNSYHRYPISADPPAQSNKQLKGPIRDAWLHFRKGLKKGTINKENTATPAFACCCYAAERSWTHRPQAQRNRWTTDTRY